MVLYSTDCSSVMCVLRTYVLVYDALIQGYSTNFNEGPVGEVWYFLRSSLVELLICNDKNETIITGTYRKIVGFSAAKQVITFFFLEIAPFVGGTAPNCSRYEADPVAHN